MAHKKDIIRQTVDELNYGCDGFAYHMQQFIDNYIRDHDKRLYPWLKVVDISFNSDYLNTQNITEMGNLIISKPTRTIKIELIIDQNALREATHGNKI